MKINIGSKNPVKVNALKDAMDEYDLLKGSEIFSVETDPGVADQPKSLEETIDGAINRAKAVFNECDLSFGIEDGLMAVPKTSTGYMNACACAIYDGKDIYLGLSSGFEYPKEVARLVLEEGMNVSEAMNKAGLTDNPEIGSFEGAIGVLSKSKLSRTGYTRQAIVAALVRLENSDLY